MIDKSDAEKAGIRTVQGGTTKEEKLNETRKALSALLPSVINSDGQLDVQALRDELNPSESTSNNQGYELTFAGKGIARAEANEPTDYELSCEHAQSKDWQSTGNVVIKGDNLDALKILQANYASKIKMIYIDPPYNTRNDDFIYKNDFRNDEKKLIEEYRLNEETTDFLHNVYGTKSHSGWLTFMYPRLKLSRELLQEDGVIVIAIDHYELNNLICIADEIYGEENRLGLISVVHKPEGRNQAKFFAPSNEFMLFYSKNINECSFRNTVIDNTVAETFDMEDNAGKYRLKNFIRLSDGKYSLRESKPDFFYPIYVSADCKDISLVHKDDYTQVLPITKSGQERTWKTKPDTFYKYYTEGNIVAKTEDNSIAIYEKLREKQILKTFWIDKKYHAFHHGTKVIEKLLQGAKIFDFPKSVYLVQDILKLTTTSNDIILDFFAGSGTTGDAVMRLNAEDGGKRRYILVQLDEAIDKKKNKEAYDFCEKNRLEPVISSICIERLNRAGEKLCAEHQQKHSVDIGYKVFSLTDKPRMDQDDTGVFKVDNERKSVHNTLYTMLCATCKPLHLPIETIIENTLYQCDDELYVLASVPKETLEKYKDRKVNIDAYANLHLEDFLNLGVAQSENITVIW